MCIHRVYNNCQFLGDRYRKLQLLRVIRKLIIGTRTRLEAADAIHAQPPRNSFASHDTVLFLHTLFSHQSVRHYGAFSLLVSFILFKS